MIRTEREVVELENAAVLEPSIEQAVDRLVGIVGLSARGDEGEDAQCDVSLSRAILGEEDPGSKHYVIGVTVPVMKSAVRVMNGRSIALLASLG